MIASILKELVNEEGYLVLPSGNFVHETLFLEMFGGGQSYDDLIQLNQNSDGTKKGYKALFDLWKVQGRIDY